MSKINLANANVSEDPLQEKKRKGFLPPGMLRPVLLLIISAVGGSFLLDQLKSEQARNVDIVLEKLTTEQKALRKKIEQAQALSEVKTNLDSSEAHLSQSLISLNKALSKRGSMLKLLSAVSESIPENSWLVELNISKIQGEAKLKGGSIQSSDFSTFQLNLENSQIFKDISISQSMPIREGSRTSMQFTMAARILEQ